MGIDDEEDAEDPEFAVPAIPAASSSSSGPAMTSTPTASMNTSFDSNHSNNSAITIRMQARVIELMDTIGE